MFGTIQIEYNNKQSVFHRRLLCKISYQQLRYLNSKRKHFSTRKRKWFNTRFLLLYLWKVIFQINYCKNKTPNEQCCQNDRNPFDRICLLNKKNVIDIQIEKDNRWVRNNEIMKQSVDYSYKYINVLTNV